MPLGSMSVDEVPEAEEIFMDAGVRTSLKPDAPVVNRSVESFARAQDVLLFTDAISHGSAKRVNPGDRRVLVHRYGPAWGNFRIGASRVSPIGKQRGF